MQIPIIKGDAISNKVDYIDYLPKNLVAVSRPVMGADGYLISHDGLTSLGVIVPDADRGAFYDDRRGLHVRVIGEKAYRYFGGVLTEVGVIPGSDQCSFTYSFNNTLIIGGGKAYLYDGIQFNQITDTDIGSPIDADWINGYFFYTDGEYLYHSLITDEAQVDSLQFATAELMPDKTLGVKRTTDNLMAVFGRYSIEYFVSDPTQLQFKFSRITQKAVAGGICGTHCKVVLDDLFFILGGRKNESPSFHIVGSGSLTCVSTRSVDKIVSSYTDEELATVVMESRVIERDKLIMVRMPRHTLLYNHSIAESVGTQFAWTLLTRGTLDRPWRGINGIYDTDAGKWIYGSDSGELFYLDDTKASQGDEDTEWQFGTPLIPAKATRLSKVELNTVNGFQSDVIAGLSVSINGVTNGTEVHALYSRAGIYDTRLLWRRIGYIPRQFSLNVRGVCSAKVNFSNLDVTYG